ncbi:sulfate ABC transporter substrate-binding protein [Hyphomicrobium sulfonivorans]|uniref:sulfate ABC transporter substrate-binding protein n=1 Tax=Hyphomicrobium sulfonivorans TaxID=121290 RepID=UPI001570263F|nr:sulfate ABC transporter substrate-binding protein [Hyphomicrobium sulfonivorans]MBI1651305.1 sulfate ABC transporter substrate-binding protein [Hyphomicrobium sulfonivorans]NSL73271.1 sulfate ABC transporter substrate-binding protein [Hyphomicrobium sulfonivorans]
MLARTILADHRVKPVRTAVVAAVALLAGAGAVLAEDQKTLLNASYDVSRELYKDINAAFIAAEKSAGKDVAVNQSHGGSTKQALAVANGLEADVVTFNQAPDIDILAKAGVVDADWRAKFPNNASPYTTTSVFLVRKGNPKQIKDWDDLAKPGIEVIVPNPKTSGNGRYTYLAAWGDALRKTGSEEGAQDFVAKLFANVPVLDGGGRGATTTFTQRDKGDVLVTFENEAALIGREIGADKFEVVYPKASIIAEPPVAIVNPVVDRRNSRELAKAYIDFLYSPAGQEIIAKHDLRPRDADVLKANAAKFPPIETFSVEELLGGWEAVQKKHFADGGIYDTITIGKQ